MQKMITLLTHSDLDGAGAAVLARLAFGDEKLEIKCCDYENIDKHIMECLDQGVTERLLIVDISPQSEAVYNRLDAIHKEKSLKITCLDHHKTSAALVYHPWGLHDATSCGTGMFLAWLVQHDYLDESDELSRFALAVWAYDTWQLGSKYRGRGESLHRLCDFMGLDRFIATFVDSLDADTDMLIEELDVMLIDQEKRYVEEVIKTQLAKDNFISIDSMGRGFTVTYCDRHVSQVCHAILDQFPKVLYAVNLDSTRNVGDLRSRKGEIDVSKIAKHLGGGGRSETAGFPMLLREVLFVEIHRRLQGLPN